MVRTILFVTLAILMMLTGGVLITSGHADTPASRTDPGITGGPLYPLPAAAPYTSYLPARWQVITVFNSERQEYVSLLLDTQTGETFVLRPDPGNAAYSLVRLGRR